MMNTLVGDCLIFTYAALFSLFYVGEIDEEASSVVSFHFYILGLKMTI